MLTHARFLTARTDGEGCCSFPSSPHLVSSRASRSRDPLDHHPPSAPRLCATRTPLFSCQALVGVSPSQPSRWAGLKPPATEMRLRCDAMHCDCDCDLSRPLRPASPRRTILQRFLCAMPRLICWRARSRFHLISLVRPCLLLALSRLESHSVTVSAPWSPCCV